MTTNKLKTTKKHRENPLPILDEALPEGDVEVIRALQG